MKKMYFLFIVLLGGLILSGCGSERVETVTQSTVTAHLTVELLSGESIDLGSETVNIEMHKTQMIDGFTGKVESEGCFLTFPGSEYGEANLSDVSLNRKAQEIEQKANAVLNEKGGPYRFTSDIADVWNTSCDETDIYANVSLSVAYGDRNGSGFLIFTKHDEPQSAFVNIPVAFYDFILKSATEGDLIDWLMYDYPDISEVGGYTVIPGDPKALKQWLVSQQSFLQQVYFKSNGLELTSTLSKLDYTTFEEKTRTTGYGCLDYNYRGVCVDRGPITEEYLQPNTEQIDVEVGKFILK